MLNKNNRYNNGGVLQSDKVSSVKKSKELVNEVYNLVKTHLKECEIYEPNNELRIHDAPAVKLPSGKLAIAPDIRCKTSNNKIFWIEVKDKAQRVYFPDTGADLHQVLGWYDINKELEQPVLIIFKDPDCNSCLPRNPVKKDVEERFKERWNKFQGEMYGEWLSILLCLDEDKKYPCVFEERSRNIKMNILYFQVSKMRKIKDELEDIIKNVDMNIKDIQVYKRNEDKSKSLLEEKELRKLAY